MEIIAVNVGYGDAIIVKDNDFVALIDGGGDLDSEFFNNKYRVRISKFLKKYGIKHLDFLFITHIHEDHVCGLEKILDICTIDKIYTPYTVDLFLNRDLIEESKDFDRSTLYYTKALNSYINIINFAKTNNISVNTIRSGNVVDLSKGISVDVILPDNKLINEYEKLLEEIFENNKNTILVDNLKKLDAMSNSTSLLLKINTNYGSFLSAGDNTPNNWNNIDKRIFNDVKIIKLPHHGQIDSYNENYMKSMQLEYVITTSNSDKKYNSANKEVFENLNNLYEKNIRFLFTDEREYEPFFKSNKEFNAVRIKFNDENSLVDFMDIMRETRLN